MGKNATRSPHAMPSLDGTVDGPEPIALMVLESSPPPAALVVLALEVLLGLMSATVVLDDSVAGPGTVVPEPVIVPDALPEETPPDPIVRGVLAPMVLLTGGFGGGTFPVSGPVLLPPLSVPALSIVRGPPGLTGTPFI